MTRHRIVLYNPRAVFYTMPLPFSPSARISTPSATRCVIVDARLKRDPDAALAARSTAPSAWA